MQLHSFACGYPLYQAPVVEETVFSPLIDLGSLFKDPLILSQGFISGFSMSVPLAYVFVLMPAPHTLNFLNLVYWGIPHF